MPHLWRRRATLPADGYPPPAGRLGDKEYRDRFENWVRSKMPWISRDECTDIAANARLEALRSLHGYRGGNSRESFLAWLRAITIRQCSRAKHRWRPTDSLEELATQDDEPGVPDFAADLIGEQSGAILGAVQTLGQDQRNAFILHFLEGRSYLEIAEMLGGTAGKWKGRGANAMKTLRKRFKEQDDDQE